VWTTMGASPFSRLLLLLLLLVEVEEEVLWL
jgi:hypothetical protein